jgi:FHA domain
MDILEKARKLESRIARALNRASEDAVGSAVREPIEIVHAVVDTVEHQVQPGSRGTRLFPFTTAAVFVLAPTREERARFEALFAAPPSLRDRVVERLQSRGCDVRSLVVEVTYAGKAGRHWSHPQFHVTFDRVAAVASEPAPVNATSTRMDVTVLRGAAERRSYAFALPRVDLGRGVEVRDHRHRLLRTNHVVFVEGSDVNQTVSRHHAHIAVDASGAHRLHDDRSEHGTGIVRDGRTIPVPVGSRGVRLRSGDEIALGEARLRVRIGVAE